MQLELVGLQKDKSKKGRSAAEALMMPERVKVYPQLRYMGSKHRLLPWIHEVTSKLDFESAIDAFSGSGSVSYLFKTMGKRVVTNDFLQFASTIAQATTENSDSVLGPKTVSDLLKSKKTHPTFIQETFKGIFFEKDDLKFLDRVWGNLPALKDRHQKSLALAALIRSCVKRQPRGVFTISGNLDHYKDGRRDLSLSLEEHFLEQVQVYNQCIFDNGQANKSYRGDIFNLKDEKVDLVYMDPPYVPRSDDNCYVKRYHFLEGLSCYWSGLKIMEETKVKKIEKPYTPFSYRKTAVTAFDQMFSQFRKSKLVLSYSSNAFPDLDTLVSLMERYKKKVEVYEKDHRYHFGTHKAVKRAEVQEYLIVGQ